jgi:hypothetical protein
MQKKQIRFEFYTTKHGVALALLSDLSNWNTLYVNPERRRAWLRIAGPLTKEEKGALRQLSLLLRRYSPKIEKAFFFSKTESEALRTTPAKKKIQAIFRLYQPRVESVWRHELLKLETRKKLLNERSDLLIRIIERELTPLLVPKFTQTHHLVFLSLSSPLSSESAGWFWEKNKISLECSNVPIRQVNFLIGGVLLHELIHGLLRDSQVGRLFFRYLRTQPLPHFKNLTPQTGLHAEKLLEELFISCLAPEGLIYQKYFGRFRQSNQPLTQVKKLIATRMRPILKLYLARKKAIDRPYLDSLFEAIKSEIA